MRICYFLTRNLYPYLLPTVMSLLDHNQPEQIYIFCEDDTFPYELPDVCKVINVSDQTIYSADGPNFRSKFSYICLLRVCLASLIPDADRVIQLDLDTIICDDLTPIWEMDMGDNWIAMADERYGCYRPYGDRYYNAGVAVLNLGKIREDKVEPQLIHLLSTTQLPYIDQDAWNIIGAGHIADLPQRYNEFTGTEESTRPAIVHYAGVSRWWNYGIHRGSYYEKYRKFERN